jgi:MerR family transcriptional regulator, heat shock protein HspR
VSGAPSRAGGPSPDGAPDGVSPPAPAPADSAGRWSDPDAAFYTVGQVGDLLGVPAATLRRFDAVEAVRPARSAGGQRRYSSRQVQHARRLLQLTDEGLTLAAASRVAELEDTVTELRQQLSDAQGEQP